MNGQNSSMDILAELENNTKSKIASIEKSINVDYEKSFEEISQKFEEAGKITDKKERSLRLEVLGADLDSLRKDVQIKEKDLAEAVFGLNIYLENLGQEYANLGGKAAGEEKVVKDAEDRLVRANFNRQKAETKWLFKQTAIKNADQEIIDAKANLEAAKIEANKMIRERLLNSNIEGSLQEFSLRVEGTILIMQRGIEKLSDQLQNITVRKQEAYNIKKQSAELLSKLDKDLDAKESELRRQEDLLPTFINGTAEYTTQEEVISNLRASVEDLRGRRNITLGLYESKEKFVAALEIDERTTMKLRDNMKLHLTCLRSDTEERRVTFKSRLEAMKAMSDQDVAKQLDKMGAAIDQDNVEYMVKAGVASDKLKMEKLEQHPARLAKIIEAREAQAEAIHEIRLKEAAVIEEFKKKYGSDPTRSSFFHYEEKETN